MKYKMFHDNIKDFYDTLKIFKKNYSYFINNHFLKRIIIS
jgi:hypothetical protein